MVEAFNEERAREAESNQISAIVSQYFPRHSLNLLEWFNDKGYLVVEYTDDQDKKRSFTFYKNAKVNWQEALIIQLKSYKESYV